MQKQKRLTKSVCRKNLAMNRRKEQGFVLLVSILIMVMMLTLSVTTLRMAAVEEKVTANQRINTNAQLGAERAITEALNDIISATISNTGSEADPAWTASPVNAAGWAYYNSAKGQYSAADHSYGFSYTVQHKVINNTVMTDEDGVPFLRIVGTGISDKATRQKDVVIKMDYGSSTGLGTGLVGCKGITFDSNATTGSYSSSNQPSSGDKGDVKTVEPSGDIDFNSNVVINGKLEAFGKFSMDSGAKVKREAMANGKISASGGSSIGGEAYSENSISGSVGGAKHPNYSAGNTLVPQEVCDQIDIDKMILENAGIKSSNDNASDAVSKDYDEEKLTLKLGADGEQSNYYFDRLSLKDGVLEVRGTVIAYIDGNFFLAGEQKLKLINGAQLTVYMTGKFHMIGGDKDDANVGGRPANLVIYNNASDSGDAKDMSNCSVIFDSDPEFYGVIYAPKANIHMNSNAEYRGAVRGREVYSGSNLNFMYDEDLANFNILPSGVVSYDLVYWTEENPNTAVGGVVGGGGNGGGNGGGSTPTGSSTDTDTDIDTNTVTSTDTDTALETGTDITVDTLLHKDDSFCNAGDKTLSLNLTNFHTEDCKITGIDLSWPSENGSLKEISLGNNKIYGNEKNCCDTSISGGWEGSSGNRKINIDVTKTLEFKFDSTAGAGAYELLIETNNCGIIDVSTDC